jgi:hypothetical protein
VGKEKAEVACDGKEEVVVEWRQVRELVDKQLWDLFGAITLTSNPFLSLLGEKLIG